MKQKSIRSAAVSFVKKTIFIGLFAVVLAALAGCATDEKATRYSNSSTTTSQSFAQEAMTEKASIPVANANGTYTLQNQY